MKMMKKCMTALLWCVMLTAALLAQAQSHKVVKVGDFTSLKVSNNINVIYCADDEKAGTAEFDAHQSIANVFIFNNDNKGKLNIQLADYNLTKGVPTVTVYSSMLQEVINQSDSTIIINSIPDTPLFKAKTCNNGTIIIHGLNTITTELKEATGKGHIQADGVTENLVCKLVGTGVIRALDLAAKEISCTMSGSGHIYCHSTGGELKLKGFGSGKVHYTGTPSKIKVKKLGTLKALPYQGTK